MDTINNQMDLVNMELMTLPDPPPEDHVQLIENILEEFDRRIRDSLGSQNKASNSIRHFAMSFANTLKTMSPGLRLFADQDEELDMEQSLRRSDVWFDGKLPARMETPVQNRIEGHLSPPSGRKRLMNGDDSSNKRSRIGPSGSEGEIYHPHVNEHLN